MTDNEVSLIIKDLENINKRIDRMDDRLGSFINSFGEILKFQEQFNLITAEQTRIRETMKRAWDKIDDISKTMTGRVSALENAPAQKTHDVVNKFKSTFFVALCGAISAGIIGFFIYLINSYLRNR